MDLTRIKNLKFKIPGSNQAGFTLAEALISITIIAVVGFILTDLLGRSFKNNDKTETISNIKQNGQTALDVMEQVVRGSSMILCTGAIGNDQTLVVQNNNQLIRFRLIFETLTANGQVKEEFLTLTDRSLLTDQDKDFCNFDSVNQAFSVNTNQTVVLTNTNLTKGVSLRVGSFTYTKNPNFGSDFVSVQFILGPARNAFRNYTTGTPYQTPNPSILPGLDEINFQTTIKLL